MITKVLILSVLFANGGVVKANDSGKYSEIKDSLLNEAKYALMRQNEYEESGDFCSLIRILTRSNELYESANIIEDNNRNKLSNNTQIAMNLFHIGEIYQEMGFYNKAKQTDSIAYCIMDSSTRDNFDYGTNYAYDLYYTGKIDSVEYYLKPRENLLWYSTDKKYDLLRLKVALTKKEKDLLPSALKLRDGDYSTRYIENETLKTVAEIADLENNIPVLEETIGMLMESLRRHVRSSFGKLGLNGRSRLWEIYKKYCDFILYMSYKYSNNPEITRIGYDAAIFFKGLLLSSEIDIATIIRNEGNNDQKLLWNKILEFRIKGIIENEEYQEYERQLISVVPNYSQSTNRMVYGWSDVQIAMGENDVCVEFVKINLDSQKHYLAYVLKKDWDAPICIILDSEKNIKANILRGLGIYQTNGLGTTIWSQIIECCKLTTKDTLYFSADGIFYQCGIEYLPISDTLMPINECYNIIRLSNTKELCNAIPNNNPTDLVLYGGIVYDNDTDRDNKSNTTRDNSLEYLSSSMDEVNDIKKIAEDKNLNVDLYTGLKGNKSSFLELSGREVDIIHIATHGFFKRNTGQMSEMNEETVIMNRSGLYFAYDNNHTEDVTINHKRNSIVTSNDIASMDLFNVEFSVLSACKTATGDILNDGVYGLQRGFKKAGVKTLLLSLWSVDDEATRILMEHFYINFLNGKNKQEALKTAQNFLKEYKDGEYKSPKYWASFILLDAF